MLRLEDRPDSAQTVQARAALWPWEKEPYRLWSLLDMLPVHLARLMWLDVQLEQVTTLLGPTGPAAFAPPGAEVPDFFNGLKQLSIALDAVDVVCEEMPLSPHVKGNADHIRDQMRRLSGLEGSNDALNTLVIAFQKSLRLELTQHLFLMIPHAVAGLYMPKEPLFGPLVDKHLPDASRDITEAGKCYAVGQWTASVFHFIRAVEHGVRVLIKVLPPTTKVPVEYQEWHHFLTTIDKEIEATENTQKSDAREKRLKFLSGASLQINAFRHVWRLNVMHAREHYGPQEARLAMEAIKAFMQLVAEQMETGTI